MYIGFQHLHSTLAYLVLIALAIAVVLAATGLKAETYSKAQANAAKIGFILSHLMLVVGLLLYFLSPLGFSNFSGEAMGNSLARLYLVEHPFANILGIILITIGYSRAKRQELASAKNKSVLIFFGIGLLLILSRIPWSVWLA